MVMEKVPVEGKLSELGLTIVDLKVLVPDDALYSTMFIQPEGKIFADATCVRNESQGSSSAKFMRFLRLSKDEQVDLVVSPEYSCPWKELLQAIDNDILPGEGKLWVLGCESVKPGELAKYKSMRPNVFWIYENVVASSGHNFLSPVCYIFKAKDGKNRVKTVVLVQFKGSCISDSPRFFERNNMISGKNRYVIKNKAASSIRLSTLICADSLDFIVDEFDDTFREPYIFLHLQLNEDPRNDSFRRYRESAFKDDRATKEFICVNWARGIRLTGNLSQFGGSALYMKSEDLNLTDKRINSNHGKGLYYTNWPRTKTHMYFFNYDEYVFLFRAAKCSLDIAPAIKRRCRTGPEMLKIFDWNRTTVKWEEKVLADDGFLKECSAHSSNIDPLPNTSLSSMDKERLIALSNGDVKSYPKKGCWHNAENLFYLEVKADEIIKRMTFAQDPDSSSFRFEKIDRFGELKNQILTNATNFPSSLKDLSTDHMIKFPVNVKKADPYNFNICRTDGTGAATVAYLGTKSKEDAEKFYIGMQKILKDDKKRLVVWYWHSGRLHKQYDEEPQHIAEDFSDSKDSITHTE